MTTYPAEPGPHDPDAPVTPDPEVVETDMPGVDPDWPQTAAPGNESVEG
jgi:hypothetical protein